MTETGDVKYIVENWASVREKNEDKNLRDIQFQYLLKYLTGDILLGNMLTSLSYNHKLNNLLLRRVNIRVFVNCS